MTHETYIEPNGHHIVSPDEFTDKLVPELRSKADRELTVDNVALINDTLTALRVVTEQEDVVISEALLNGVDPVQAQMGRRLLSPEEEAIVSRAYYRSSREIFKSQSLLDDNTLGSDARNKAEQRLALLTPIYEESHNQLFMRNLRLASSIADKYAMMNPQISKSDLVQEANIGLLRAIQDFDPSKGFRFSTYATWWIRQGVGRYVANNARTIRVPVHMNEKIYKIRKDATQFEAEFEREASAEELAERLNMKPEEVQRALDAHLRTATASLNKLTATSDGRQDTELGDLIEDTSAVDMIEYTHTSDIRDTIRTELSRLSVRERQIVEMRFGLNDGNPLTLEAIGKELGVTRERVRQIEKKALLKLRKKSLKTYMGSL